MTTPTAFHGVDRRVRQMMILAIAVLFVSPPVSAPAGPSLVPEVGPQQPAAPQACWSWAPDEPTMLGPVQRPRLVEVTQAIGQFVKPIVDSTASLPRRVEWLKGSVTDASLSIEPGTFQDVLAAGLRSTPPADALGRTVGGQLGSPAVQPILLRDDPGADDARVGLEPGVGPLAWMGPPAPEGDAGRVDGASDSGSRVATLLTRFADIVLPVEPTAWMSATTWPASWGNPADAITRAAASLFLLLVVLVPALCSRVAQRLY